MEPQRYTPVIVPYISCDPSREYFDWLRGQLKHKNMDDWYNPTQDDINNHHGGGILNYYNNSPSKALQDIYPEHNWNPELFKNKPSSLWNHNNEQRKAFFRHLSQSMEEAPPRFWANKENHRAFFDWSKGQLGYQIMDDWYNITNDDIRKNGGSALFCEYYGGSPSAALQSVYPEHVWLLWKFQNLPKGYWEDLEHQQSFFRWLEKELGLRQLDDFYKLKAKDIEKYGLRTLLHKYGGSSLEAMRTIYPAHKWVSTKFFW